MQERLLEKLSGILLEASKNINSSDKSSAYPSPEERGRGRRPTIVGSMSLRRSAKSVGGPGGSSPSSSAWSGAKGFMQSLIISPSELNLSTFVSYVRNPLNPLVMFSRQCGN